MAGLPDRFPTLRMVFVEIASQWVPWTLKDLARRLPQQRGRALPENPMRAYRDAAGGPQIAHAFQVGGVVVVAVVGPRRRTGTRRRGVPTCSVSPAYTH